MSRYKPWHTSDIVDMIKRRQANKFDVIVLVTGNRGDGKSSLSVKCALRLPNFKMKRDIVFSREEVIEQLATKEKGVIIADEFINVGFNRDFYDKDQKKLIKMLNMYRDRGNILFLCVPNFTTIDKQILGLAKFRLDVIKRGWALLHTPNRSSYSHDPWDIKYNEKIEKGWLDRGIRKPDYKRLSTFRALIRVTDLTENQREIYEKIKAEKRNELYEKEVREDSREQGSKYQAVYDGIINGTLVKKDIEQYCKLNKTKWSTATAVLNKMLKDREQPTLKTLLLANEGLAPIPTNVIKNLI